MKRRSPAVLVSILSTLALNAPAQERVLFQDDFDSRLGPGWTWVREHPGAWRISSRGLEVRIEPGNMWGSQNDAKNILTRLAPDPNSSELAVSVVVENQPAHQYEQTDLAWYYDDSNMVKLGQEMVDGKRSIVMGREEQDKTRTIAILPLAADSVELKLIVSGNQIRGRYRPKGETDWLNAGQCDLPPHRGLPPRLSLQCYQGSSAAEHWARLTAFKVVASGPDFSKAEIRITPVAATIHMLEGVGGNIAVSSGEDGMLMVDDQYAPLADKIEAALKRVGTGPLKYVLNTHFHGDHTGGNEHFGQRGTIIAQANVRKRLAHGVTVTGGLPVITFDNQLSVHFNGEEIKLIHLEPGHTDGDTVVVFTRANVVHTGDQFFSGRFPNIDLAGGGSVRGYLRNVERLLRELPEGARLIPGHGPLSTRKELEEFHQMLLATSALVEQAIAAGKTLEQVKAEGLPERWAKWAAPTLPVERWLEILYRGLSALPKPA